MEFSTRPLRINGTDLRLACMERAGSKTPIVFMHGFGSTKEDYADVTRHPAFDGHHILAWDAPGCGETEVDDLSVVSVPFQVAVAQAMIAGFGRVHLVGHSMGGLGALVLAGSQPERIASFADIEGNVAPEDCFLSRQILDHADPDPERFFEAFIARTRAAKDFSSPLYAASLRHKVRARAVAGIFRSMVVLSDQAGLIDRFTGLPCPKMFMHGEDNAHLSYLPHLRAQGVQVTEIPQCGHFPMYANAPRMWAELGGFIARAEA